MSTRMDLKSRRSPEPGEPEIKQQKVEEKVMEGMASIPFIKFDGKVEYASDFVDCASVCDNLLKIVNDSQDEEMIIGFDMEWPFNFQAGAGKTALIQICHDLKTCYLLHVSQIKAVPQSLVEFLQHPKVRLTGVNIKNDINKLLRDFSGFDADQIIPKCIDTSVLANGILPVRQKWSMEKLVNYVLKMRINKDKKLRMSRWNKIPLEKEQEVYAATDAHVSLLLYLELKKWEQENMKKELEREEKIKAEDPKKWEQENMKKELEREEKIKAEDPKKWEQENMKKELEREEKIKAEDPSKSEQENMKKELEREEKIKAEDPTVFQTL